MPVSAFTPPRVQQGSTPQAGRPQNLSILRAMTKSMIEAISEVIRDPKHPFRKADSQPKKAMKNRYERRKIKEYLHLADWQAEEAI
jgi:hypothetical protein